MFDVVDEWEERAVPNATIKFKRQVPKNIEVVPVVFIVKDIFENSVKDSLKVEKLAAQIVERVTRMCSWNGITNWSGLQMDCDWTESNRNTFYLLCKEVREILPKDKRVTCKSVWIKHKSLLV